MNEQDDAELVALAAHVFFSAALIPHGYTPDLVADQRLAELLRERGVLPALPVEP